jgi:hypothetical protein
MVATKTVLPTAITAIAAGDKSPTDTGSGVAIRIIISV